MEKCESTSTTVCRTCLGEEGEFQSVFVTENNTDTDANSLQLSDMIMSCTSLEVILGDGLPDHICNKCVTTVMNMYNFRNQCINSDKLLRERLQNVSYQNEEFKCEANVKVELFDKTVDYQDEVILQSFETFGLETCIQLEKSDVENVDTSDKVQDTPKEPEAANSEPTENQQPILEEFDNLDESESEVPVEEVNNAQEVHAQDKLKQVKDKKFQCEICQKRFSRNDLLLRHKIVHAIKMEEQLSEQVQYVNNQGLVLLTQVQFPCLKCDIAFVEEEDLNRHIIKNHDKKNLTIPCEVCGKKFSTLSHKKRHLRTTHLKDKHYRCPTCEKTFSRKEQFNHHMNGHSGLKPHICDICFKGFNQISNLKDHMRTHNGEKPFLCSTCGKGFNQLGNLRQHTIRHSGVKAHLCSTCGSSFASKGELSAHLRKHTGARPFVCPICNHGFTTSSSLTKHKRIHSGEKPYECDTCKMKFSRSGILARHKRTHTGEKPYKCQFCSKAFCQSNDLTSHLRIHTGEKPYICDQCGQAFRQSSALKAHKKTHIEKTRIVLNGTINGFIPTFL